MALKTIEIIKDAEISASGQISDAERKAAENIKSATKEADKIVAEAKSESELLYKTKTQQADSESQKIILSSRNAAEIKAEALLSDSVKKQAEVDKLILQILI